MQKTETGQEPQGKTISTDDGALTRVQSYGGVQPYRTKDGSTIRELMHPAVQGNHAQSLAEAVIPVGKRTFLHQHHRTEEKLSKPTHKKQPKLFINKGEDAKALRKKLGLHQADFWGRIMVTQSGGSRYESGRDMPEPVAMLVHLTYGSEKQALALLEHLRSQISKSASFQ